MLLELLLSLGFSFQASIPCPVPFPNIKDAILSTGIDQKNFFMCVNHSGLTIFKSLHTHNPLFCTVVTFSTIYRKLHDLGIVGDLAFFSYKTSQYLHLLSANSDSMFENLYTNLLFGHDSVYKLTHKVIIIDEAITNCQNLIAFSEAPFSMNFSNPGYTGMSKVGLNVATEDLVLEPNETHPVIKDGENHVHKLAPKITDLSKSTPVKYKMDKYSSGM